MENYKILICDDEKNIVDSISNEIIKYYKRRNIKVDLFPFIDGKDASIFLNEKIVDAVFLDIEIDKISGIQLAKQVREKSIETQIIFITGHEKYQKYVFSFHVFDYIMKPILLSELYNLLDELTVYISNKKSNYIKREILRTEQGIIGFNITSIVCFEKVNRKVIIYLVSGEVYYTNLTIKELVDLFSKYDEYFQPHKAYLINMNHIFKFNNSDLLIEMSNGINIPLSQLKAKSFRNLYIQLISKRDRLQR